jgi:hypothetical protein
MTSSTPCLSKNIAQKEDEKILEKAVSCAVPLLHKCRLVLQEVYKREPRETQSTRRPRSPETRRLIDEEAKYIIKTCEREKPNIEEFKEILSRSGYHYVIGMKEFMSTINVDAPELAAYKDINESSIVIFVEDKRLLISDSSREGDYYELPFCYNNKTKISNALRKTSRYKIWRALRMQRDGHKCQMCGRGLKELNDLNIKLIVHHRVHLDYIIKAWIATLEQAIRYFKPELFDLKNGITCCEVCHRWYFHPNGTKVQQKGQSAIGSSKR